MDFSPLFAKLLTFIALMLAGYAGARKNILCPGFAKSLSWLVMDVFLSCTILRSLFVIIFQLLRRFYRWLYRMCWFRIHRWYRLCLHWRNLLRIHRLLDYS